MANVTVQARVSPELKQEAEAVFSAIGMSTAEAMDVKPGSPATASRAACTAYSGPKP